MAGSILAGPPIAQPAVGGQPYDVTGLILPGQMASVTSLIPGADVTTTLWSFLFSLIDTTPPSLVFALAPR